MGMMYFYPVNNKDEYIPEPAAQKSRLGLLQVMGIVALARRDTLDDHHVFLSPARICNIYSPTDFFVRKIDRNLRNSS
jgi:hypothetical protein